MAALLGLAFNIVLTGILVRIKAGAVDGARPIIADDLQADAAGRYSKAIPA